MQRGTDGLAAVAFRAANQAADPIECDAATAHWYSVVIGRAEPGGAVSAELWSDPATGALYVLNERADRMPIQTLWCGFAGKSVSSRSDVRLARHAGAVEPPIALACTGRAPEGVLTCSRD